jgi:ABC-type amino acid transport system permease subunit
MITEELINNADEKVKSLYSENKRLWCWIYILICVSIVFGIILLYFIFRKLKNNLEHRKDNISPSMTLLH